MKTKLQQIMFENDTEVLYTALGESLKLATRAFESGEGHERDRLVVIGTLIRTAQKELQAMREDVSRTGQSGPQNEGRGT